MYMVETMTMMPAQAYAQGHSYDRGVVPIPSDVSIRRSLAHP